MNLSQLSKNYIQNKLIALQTNNYAPSINKNIRFLTLFACHVDKKLKEEAITENLKYLNFTNNDIIVINSKNTNFDRSKIKTIILDYIEIENDSNTLDIGKFVYAIEKHDVLKYDFVVFINDSIILKNSINHFYNLMIKKNVELYGYNSSSEVKYHYQSFLYGIKSTSVNKLMTLYYSKKQFLTGWKSVVNLIELYIVDIFETHDCFLDLAIMPENIKKNITHHNKELYDILFKNKLFPIVKIKTL